MVGISQDVNELERALTTTRIERDRLLADKAHLETVNGIQAETITLLQSERDRYFKASNKIGALCEFVADGLIAGIKGWKDESAPRTRPEDPMTRIIASAAGMPSERIPEIDSALAKLNEVAGKPTFRSADRLPRVEPR